MQTKPKPPKQDPARRVAELEAERRVLLAQLNLQATGSEAGLSGVWAVGLAIPAKHVDIPVSVSTLQAHSLATATATNRELAGAAAAAAAMAEHCTRLEVSVNRVRTCSSKFGRDARGGGATYMVGGNV